MNRQMFPIRVCSLNNQGWFIGIESILRLSIVGVVIATISLFTVGVTATVAAATDKDHQQMSGGQAAILVAQGDDNLLGGDDGAGDDDLLSDDDDLSGGDDGAGDDDLLSDDDDLSGGDDGAGDDDLLSDDDDLVGDDDDFIVDDDNAPAKAKDDEVADKDPNLAHAQVFLNDRYPSATQCASCHPKHYKEWSISQHAYAQMSPVFNAMQGSIGMLTNGTLGDFCIRCHTPVGMNLKEKEFMSNIDRHPTSREGITCIACHRVSQAYGKITGRLAIVEGGLTEPIYGPTGSKKALPDAIAESSLKTNDKQVGRKVHAEVNKFFQLTTSGFCGSCHDVTEANGFRLEEAFSEWKNSPANKKGISCQDCHMGNVPGKVLASRDDPDFVKKNYAFGPAATIGRYETPPRKLTNHMFVGPDHTVLPPSLFPLNAKAIKEESQKDDPSTQGLATIRQWLEFDIDAGWGTDEFENNVQEGHKFPEAWEYADDRYDARDIIDENLVLLKEMRQQQLILLRNGYVLEDIVVDKQDPNGISFRVKVASGTDGHNVPTGFDGERLVWLYVRVMDATGKVIHVSGDLDPNGDVRDLHSAYVHNHELDLDKELLNLQSKFLTFATRGAEREQVIAVPTSLTVIPFLQPERRSAVLLGQHFGARKHRQGIEPDGHRWGKYQVKSSEMTGKGPYKAIVQLKAAMVPVNLINKIKEVGFDYGLSARDISEALKKGHQMISEKEIVFDLDASHSTVSLR